MLDTRKKNPKSCLPTLYCLLQYRTFNRLSFLVNSLLLTRKTHDTLFAWGLNFPYHTYINDDITEVKTVSLASFSIVFFFSSRMFFWVNGKVMKVVSYNVSFGKCDNNNNTFRDFFFRWSPEFACNRKVHE